MLKFIGSFLIPVRFAGRAIQMHRQELNVIRIFWSRIWSMGIFGNRRLQKHLMKPKARQNTFGRSSGPRHPSRSSELLSSRNLGTTTSTLFSRQPKSWYGFATCPGSGGWSRTCGQVFSIDQPFFVLNSLRTETKSEHKVLYAPEGMFRSRPKSLGPRTKILWEGEDDPADYLSLISLLHRKLDDCVPNQVGEYK